jgi:hypothetical protein
MAIGLMAITLIPFGFVTVSNVINAMRGRALELPWASLGVTVLVVWGSYLLASQIGAFAYFLFRPLRPRLFGWLVTGYVLAVVAYGTIAIALALFFDPVGQIFLEDSTRAEAWAMVRVTPWLGIVGAAGGMWQWWKGR